MSTTNSKVIEISDYLNVYLDLNRNPVGIRFINNGEDFQKSEFKKYDKKIPYCTMIRNCTTDNAYLLDLDNFSCIAAATFLGLTKPLDEFISGERYTRLKVYKDLETSKKIVDTMSIMEQNTVGVEIGTLSNYNTNPDIIIIICDAYNAMRLVQAYSYTNGYTTHNRMLGMCALCHECTSYPYLSNELNISLMCSGTRCVAQWQDSELGVGIPFNKIDDILEGLKKTSNLMDPNTKKQRIEQEIMDNDNLHDEQVTYNKNYYTNTYLKNK